MGLEKNAFAFGNTFLIKKEARQERTSRNTMQDAKYNAMAIIKNVLPIFHTRMKNKIRNKLY